MSKKQVIGVVAVLALGAAGYALLAPREVSVTRVQTGSAVESVYATGTIETTAMVRVLPKVSGRIEAFFADEGDRLNPGDRMAALDNGEAKARIDEHRALVDFYKVELDRAEQLLKQKTGTAQNRDRARSDYLNAQALLRSAEVNLNEHTLASPGRCRVIRRDGEIGEYVTSTSEVFWLDCSGKYRITSEVDEADINHVKAGQRVLLRYEGMLEEVYEGTIAAITPKGDDVSRVFRVRIEIPEGQPPEFALGMSVEVNIITGVKNDAVLVPNDAVADGAVWIVDAASRLERREVSIGIVGNERTEITEGLEVGERIALKALDWFSDGRKVTVRVVTRPRS